jgi:hypothetical protein
VKIQRNEIYVKTSKSLTFPDLLAPQMPERKVTLKEARFWLKKSQLVHPRLKATLLEKAYCENKL